jgi:hypothetical protein
MKVEKVNRIEVKRCFAISEKGKVRLRKKQGKNFQEELIKLANEVQNMPEIELDELINWDPRRQAYDKLTWYFEDCSIDDLGVWFGYNQFGIPEGAGELPAD